MTSKHIQNISNETYRFAFNVRDNEQSRKCRNRRNERNVFALKNDNEL